MTYTELSAYSPTGDGVADDTSAVQTALNSGDPHIWLSDGAYSCSTLTVPNSVRKITGPGRLLQRALNSNLLNLNNVQDVHIDGVTMVGAGTVGMTQVVSGNNAVHITNGSRNIRVTNCDVSLFSIFGVYAEGSEVIKVSDNLFKNTGCGVRMAGVTDAKITGNTLEDTIFPENEFVTAIGLDSTDSGFDPCKDVKIAGNTITGFVNAQGILAHAGYNVEISGNTIDGAVIGVGATAYNTTDYMTVFVIANNIIMCPSTVNHTPSGADGITLMGGASSQGGTTPNPRDFLVIGNQIHNANRAEQNTGQGGIRALDAMRATIIGNHIQGAQGNGIVIDGYNPELVCRSNRCSQIIPIGAHKNGVYVKGSYTGDVSDNWSS